MNAMNWYEATWAIVLRISIVCNKQDRGSIKVIQINIFAYFTIVRPRKRSEKTNVSKTNATELPKDMFR